jgi:cytochrome c biogenesis protein CcdA
VSKILYAYSIVKTLTYISVLILILAHFYINAQIVAIQVEMENMRKQISDLNVLKDKLKDLGKKAEILALEVGIEAEIYSLTGSIPYRIKPIFNDTVMHVYAFLNTNCPLCEEDYKQQFNLRVKNWISEKINVEGWLINIAKNSSIADRIYREINSSKPRLDTIEIIALYNDLALKIPWSLSDEVIVKALEKTAELKNTSRIDTSITIPEIPELNQKTQPIENPIAAFIIGAVQGFNPCIIAIMTFIIAAISGGGKFMKLTAIALGVLYSYLIFSFIMFSSPVIVQNIQYATTAIIITLIILIVYYLIELSLEIRAERIGVIMDASRGILPIFKTPKPLLKLANRTISSRNPYLYFTLGLIFSLVKMPCIAPVTAYYIAKLPYQPIHSLVNIIALNIGTITPYIVLAVLACMGVLTLEKLASMRGLKIRILQRIIVIAALKLTVIFLLIAK